ncbi:hypothetical protein IWZ00DRAFT_89732 [Phyllosticta capitalensis]
MYSYSSKHSILPHSYIRTELRSGKYVSHQHQIFRFPLVEPQPRPSCRRISTALFTLVVHLLMRPQSCFRADAGSFGARASVRRLRQVRPRTTDSSRPGHGVEPVEVGARSSCRRSASDLAREHASQSVMGCMLEKGEKRRGEERRGNRAGRGRVLGDNVRWTGWTGLVEGLDGSRQDAK